MIGIVTGGISGICVIDRDDLSKAEIEAYLPDAVDIPISSTPRGGQHLYFRMPEKLIGNNAGAIPGCDFRGEGGYVVAPPSVNNTGKAYEWVTSLNDCEPPALPAAIISIYKGSSYLKRDKNCDKAFQMGRRDEDLFHAANCLAKGGASKEFATETLEFLAKNCNPPFPPNEVAAKVKSAFDRSARREINLAEAVRQWVAVTDGYFSVSDCFNALQSVTSVTNRDNVRQILHRLRADGVIEKHGSQDGVYRRVDNRLQVLNWWEATGEPFAIAWPFELEKLVTLYPKNIAVIAGAPNAGKTTIGLNTARLNINRYPIRYLTSEMGENELRNRLGAFEANLDDWRKIEFIDRASSFAPMVLPNGLTIIDYLEISDKFWLVAEELKQIYEKLETGVAVVCLQKTQGKDAGRGGDFGLEKPRLYLNLDQDPPQGNLLTIRKAKEWADKLNNPNHKKLRFKIIGGAKLVPVGDWYYETSTCRPR